MLGSAREGSAPSLIGTFWGYVVTDEPDALYERAVAAGAQVVSEMEDTDYGSRGFLGPGSRRESLVLRDLSRRATQVGVSCRSAWSV